MLMLVLVLVACGVVGAVGTGTEAKPRQDSNSSIISSMTLLSKGIPFIFPTAAAAAAAPAAAPAADDDDDADDDDSPLLLLLLSLPLLTMPRSAAWAISEASSALSDLA
jgi:hypothetical protein